MDTATLERWAPYVLSILRIVTAVLFFEHGLQKIFNIPPAAAGAHHPELFSLIGLAGVLELVGGALLIVGLFTRPVAFILSGEMAFAYWMAHAPQSFFPLLNRGDAAILFCFVFLYLVFAGPGPWSVDAARNNRA
ncbi:DoxX family protein [Hyphomicrobium sp.]|jgi:putative oxidoreductase|uniref:DoxX family protein n=1 Tax=Hyphomicrobium sp. TaxID=82 RepID=UPI002C9AA7C3|nr:DoxX family protein [Hyphomicrobium sp.]HVZ05018.1 DoxX family protein [Hyphomicrobium sp.]